MESGPSLSIKGNLKTNIEFWKFIDAPNKKGVSEWCMSKRLTIQLPFPVSTVSLYIFEIMCWSCTSSASPFIQANAALKINGLIP